MAALDDIARMLLERLLWTSLQATALIVVVAAAIRWLPRLPAATRCLLWWLVGLQLLLGLAWPAPIALPLAPAAAPTALVVAAVPAPTSRATAPAVQPESSAPAVPATASLMAAHAPSALLGAWLAGLLLALLPLATRWRRARAQRLASAPASDPALRALCARRANELGLARAPTLRLCAGIDSPQVTGPWRPTVLLPAEHTLTPAELAMALDHELAHLRRGDLWLAWVPALAQQLFFFHPLVRWAVREYALQREAACDAQVLRHARAAPQEYGRLLLRLGVSHPLHAGLAGASPTFENLKRRLTMLQHIEPSSRARGWLLVLAVAAIGLLPYRVTRATEPADATAPAAAAVAAAAALAAPAAPAASAAAAAGDQRVPPAPPAPPPPPPANVPAPPPPPPPPAPPALPADLRGASHVDIDTDEGAAYGFALFDGDSITMNGTSRDVATARALRRSDEPLLWFRRGTQAYVVRDAALLARARALYAPVTALAREQGRLGGQQGELGGRQGGLGARQGELAGRQAELASEQAALAGSADREQRMPALQSRLQALQAQQEALGREQAELGRQQAALGTQQAALGKRQADASAQAARGMDTLLDEALAKGLAQPVTTR